MYTLGVVRFIRGHWVHWDAPWGPSGSYGFASFTGIRTGRPISSGGHRVHQGLLGSLGCALGAVENIPSNWVHLGTPSGPSGSSGVDVITGVCTGCHRVHPVKQGSLGCALEAVRFIQGRWKHWGPPWVLSGSSGVAGFAGVRTGGH